MTRFAVMLTMVAACSGPQRPAVVTTEVPARIASVDLVPIDLELWLGTGANAEPAQVRSTMEAQIANAAIAALEQRAYAVGALVDWNGDAGPRGNVMPKDALRTSVGAMARYGTVAREGRMPVPVLPARLGERTGSDATLFISGWSFVEAPQQSRANQIAEKVALGIVTVAAVTASVAAVAALESQLPPCGWACHVYDAPAPDPAPAAEPRDPPVPRSGPSRLYLEMTLVDNATGRPLWHVHQELVASPREVERAARTLLASLPARASAR